MSARSRSGVGHGKKAARHIDAWLRAAPARRTAKHPTATFDSLHLWYFGDAAQRRQPELEAADARRRVSTRSSAACPPTKRPTRRGVACRAATASNATAVSAACPEDAVIKLGVGHRYEFDYDKCTGCGVCADQCPVHAIEMFPEPT